MKSCSKCRETKPFLEFFKNRHAKDGYCSWCKSCMLASNKTYRQTEKGKKVIRKAKAKYRHTPKGKAARCSSSARFDALNPNQVKAKYAVNHAVRVGRLPRANTQCCHYCPNPARHYHHWRGYEPEHWMDVLPVCVGCHRKEHIRKIA